MDLIKRSCLKIAKKMIVTVGESKGHQEGSP